MRHLLLACFLLIFQVTYSQTPVQSIRGQVTDAITGKPLGQAHLQLLDHLGKGSTTDSTGHYEISLVPVGRYQLRISFEGYQAQIQPEVLISSGKQTVLDVQLYPSLTSLPEVVVSGFGQDISSLTSAPLITLEQVKRFPATFNDPARLLAGYAGINGGNDQGNLLSIRGHTPNHNAWRVDGIDIVNPNHLSNAGTLSDLPTRNAGGTNILSTQLIGNTTVLNSNAPVGYSNAIGGTLDLQLRPGNAESTEWTAGASLIGLEFAGEGPLVKGKNHSWASNYRYSTIGLLSAIGVPLGDEAIDFQDLAFTFQWALPKGGYLRVFAFGGTGNNIFKHQTDSIERKSDKDFFDISFKSKMGATGIAYTQPLGAGILKINVGYSGLQHKRTSTRFDNNNQPFFNEYYALSENLLSTQIVYQQPLNAGNFKIGIRGNRHQIGLSQVTQLAQRVASGWWIQPYAEIAGPLFSGFDYRAGIQWSSTSLGKGQTLEPRIALGKGFANNKHRIALEAALNSQLAPLEIFATQTDAANQLAPTKSISANLIYGTQLSKNTRLQIKPYLQWLYDVPAHKGGLIEYSVLNSLEGTFGLPLINQGQGRYAGVEASIQRFMNQGWFWQFHLTVYESLYRINKTDAWRKTRFDGQYGSSLLIGKEWSKLKNNKKKHTGLNLRILLYGNQRVTPIDLDASRLAGSTIFNQNAAYTLALDPYFRTDLRAYWRTDKAQRSSTFFIDLQNLSNQQNEGWIYYDSVSDKVLTKNQLGIIPVLGWRLEF